MRWADISTDPVSDGFVGREKEIGNLALYLGTSPSPYQVFFICGPAGAGKTYLLKRYKTIALQFGFIVPEVDERHRTVPEVLGHFASQFAAAGHTLRTFTEHYSMYVRRKSELERDPNTPQGLLAALGSELKDLLFDNAARQRRSRHPGSRRNHVTEDELSTWLNYLVQKNMAAEELMLLQSPDDTLTSHFFDDLNEIATKQPILLCFENFEATRGPLQTWFSHLADHNPDANIRLAIACRTPPGPAWEPLSRRTLILPIDVFTDDEADAFLDINGIVGPQLRAEIKAETGRLPVLMNWLVSTYRHGSNPVLEAGNIVERSLRWIEDATLRQVVLLAALPRSFNLDVVTYLLDSAGINADPTSVFTWLQRFEVVTFHETGWQYHPVIRRMMLRHQRQVSESQYRQRHTDLASFFDKRRNSLGLSQLDRWGNQQWRSATISYLYHRLGSNPALHTMEVISMLLITVMQLPSMALSIHQLLNYDDVSEDLSAEHEDVVALLHQHHNDLLSRNFDAALPLVERLLHSRKLTDDATAVATFYRGFAFARSESMQDSFREMNKVSLSHLSELNDHFIGSIKSMFNILQGRDAEAEADYTLLIKRYPDDAVFYANRGTIRRTANRYTEAEADYTRAIALRNDDALPYAGRGSVRLALSRYPAAVEDYTEAIRLTPDDAKLYVHRGEGLFWLEKFPEAEADFTRAIELDASDAQVYAHRGAARARIGQYTEAELDFTHALTQGREDSLTNLNRGLVRNSLEKYAEAEADFTRALTLDRNSVDAYFERGKARYELNRYEEAEADFTRALKLDSKNAYAYFGRGRARYERNRVKEAEADITRALRLDPEIAQAYAYRGMIRYILNQYETAEADYTRALALDLQNAEVYVSRAMVRYDLNRYEEAEADFNRALTLDPKSTFAYRQRGKERLWVNRYEEAEADLTHALTLDPKDALAYSYRGDTRYQLKRYDEAVDDYKSALDLAHDNNRALVGLGLSLGSLGRYEEAYETFQRLLKLDHKDLVAKYNSAVAFARWKSPSDAVHEIAKARSECMAEVQGPQKGIALYGLAGLAAVNGNPDEAFTYLEQGIQFELDILRWLRNDIAWNDLRNHPRPGSLLLPNRRPKSILIAKVSTWTDIQSLC